MKHQKNKLGSELQAADYSNEQQVKDMLASIQNCQLPAVPIPKCPRCGEEMMNHLRIDNRFVETDVWHMQQRYSDFCGSYLKNGRCS